MEKISPSEREERIRNLTPPKSATASMVLNGAGNGMMLGGLPYLATELYSNLAHKKISSSVKNASQFAVVLGAAIGAVYGAKEAKDLKNYRESLRDELADLRAQTDMNSNQLNSWAEKEQARAATSPEGHLTR